MVSSIVFTLCASLYQGDANADVSEFSDEEALVPLSPLGRLGPLVPFGPFTPLEMAGRLAESDGNTSKKRFLSPTGLIPLSF